MTTFHSGSPRISTRSFKHVLPGLVLFLSVFTGCAVKQVEAVAIEASPTVTSTIASFTPTPEKTAYLPQTVIRNTPVPTQEVCDQKHGKILDSEVPNSILSYSLRVKIYLPPCFTKKPATPYPYIVMIHGMLYNYDQWDRLGIDEAADELIATGEVDPFVIVMPNEEQTTANPEEEKFSRVITKNLIPWMTENYPVCGDRSCRAIGGLSRGAGWAVHIGLSKPEYFGSIGAHSLPIFIGDLPATPRWLMEIPQNEMPSVYIDIGIQDGGMSPASQFEQVLTAYNVPHEWHINNGEHTESYWSSHVKEYLRWYASGWKTPVPPVILN